MPYYVWTSSIKGAKREAKRGDKVTQQELGLSREQWNALVAGGSVREKPFPAPKGYRGSAVDYLREQLRETTSMSAIEEEEVASELVKVAEARKEE